MSKMVSARIPDALHDRACSQLRALGSNPSELINSAFEYVLQEGRLPMPDSTKGESRKLSKAKATELRRLLRQCTLDVDIADDIQADKHAAREARTRKHEALA